MELTGWGKYPKIDSQVIKPSRIKALLKSLSDNSQRTLIARGLGRSYGDSSLAHHVISTEHLDHFLKFDEAAGLLTCSAGVSLAGILNVFIPKGWFLSVTPGTKFVTVGGAIASDIHGKNHHIEGSFSEYISTMKIATVSDGIVDCSRELHPNLFRATCGGMGLTGIVLEATLKLKPIKSSYINETTIKAQNLEEALNLFDAYQSSTYSVAWIDCLATGKSLGRSLVMMGEHAESGGLNAGKTGKLTVPIDMPSILLNQYTIQAFNTFYYHRLTKQRSERFAHFESFFYPLDGIHQWNRMYGKNGFIQYQFVLPKEAGLTGMTTVLKRIAESKRGSFLAVLKAFGKGNDNFLSFPLEGYTLALDFKFDKDLLPLLDELDKIVLEFGGRVYLTKDSRMSEETFKQSYPQWNEFMEVRKQYDADKVFHSLQSQRLGL